jgi:hypothetical protein
MARISQMSIILLCSMNSHSSLNFVSRNVDSLQWKPLAFARQPRPVTNNSSKYVQPQVSLPAWPVRSIDTPLRSKCVQTMWIHCSCPASMPSRHWDMSFWIADPLAVDQRSNTRCSRGFLRLCGWLPSTVSGKKACCCHELWDCVCQATSTGDKQLIKVCTTASFTSGLAHPIDRYPATVEMCSNYVDSSLLPGLNAK